MATQKQIAANRKNAQKSTGPRTDEGKVAASHNALKHGLTCRKGLIPGEDLEDFLIHREDMLDELAPEGPTELFLAERIVALSWRLLRAGRFTNAAIDALQTKMGHEIPAWFDGSLSRKVNTEPPRPLTELDFGQIILNDFEDSRVLERLSMYERRIESSLYKTIHRLHQLQLLQKKSTCTTSPRHDAPNPFFSHAEQSEASTKHPLPQQDPTLSRDPANPSELVPKVLAPDISAKRTQLRNHKTVHNPVNDNDLPQIPPAANPRQRTHSEHISPTTAAPTSSPPTPSTRPTLTNTST